MVLRRPGGLGNSWPTGVVFLIQGSEVVVLLGSWNDLDYLSHPGNAEEPPGLLPVMLRRPYGTGNQNWVGHMPSLCSNYSTIFWHFLWDFIFKGIWGSQVTAF